MSGLRRKMDWDTGGSIPMGGGTLGVDVLFDDNNGWSVFCINSSVGDPVPEFHVGGSDCNYYLFCGFNQPASHDDDNEWNWNYTK